MKYSEITQLIRQGKIGKLPNYEGYFKYNYGDLLIYFINGDYKRNINDLSLENRDDWYYII